MKDGIAALEVIEEEEYERIKRMWLEMIGKNRFMLGLVYARPDRQRNQKAIQSVIEGEPKWIEQGYETVIFGISMHMYKKRMEQA